MFDSYCATLGLPLERRIEEDLNEEEYPCLKDHLRKVAFGKFELPPNYLT